MHYPGGNVTDPISRVLVSSQGISSWTPLKLQHSNPNPLANQLWCIDFLTPPTPFIIPHRLPAFLESLMPLKNWCSIHARCPQSSLKHALRFCGIFSNTILLHIDFLKCPHVQIAFLKFTSCDNQALIGCIPIAAVVVHLKLKSKKSGNLLNAPHIFSFTSLHIHSLILFYLSLKNPSNPHLNIQELNNPAYFSSG